jgi:hypothetical protein
MDNNSIILTIIILSTILYFFVINNSEKEEFRTISRSSSNVVCKPKKSLLTYQLANMLEKRGTVLNSNGRDCFVDIDCNSRNCENGKCAPLCVSRSSSNYLKFK